MKIIILAGGKATRLPVSAKDIPKVLVEVGGKPILQHQIEQLAKHGFFDIRLALGYRAELIIDWLKNNPTPTDYVIEREPLDTGGAIKFASKDLKEPFMVLNGDILNDMNFSGFYRKFRRTSQENIMAVFHISDASSYGIIKRENGRIAEFLEKPLEKRQGYINAGFYILSPRVFDGVKKKRFSIEKDVFPSLAASGNLSCYTHRGFWTDAGTEERLEEVREYLQ